MRLQLPDGRRQRPGAELLLERIGPVQAGAGGWSPTRSNPPAQDEAAERAGLSSDMRPRTEIAVRGRILLSRVMVLPQVGVALDLHALFGDFAVHLLRPLFHVLVEGHALFRDRPLLDDRFLAREDHLDYTFV